MNTGMLENPITQDNIATLERYGFTVIPSESGVLACKDVGSGRLPKEDVLIEYILHAIARPKDLAGLRIAVTAGPHRSRWTRCATSPTIPPARWAMPLLVPPPCAARMSPLSTARPPCSRSSLPPMCP